ncbi:pentatricopeptide repeat-containing protein [Trifolium repens]|nr:pentatricopeptide repeat-containing protein [Trifolium repens]
MLSNSRSPDHLTYKTVLEELCSEGRVDDAFELLDECAKDKGFCNMLCFIFESECCYWGPVEKLSMLLLLLGPVGALFLSLVRAVSFVFCGMHFIRRLQNVFFISLRFFGSLVAWQRSLIVRSGVLTSILNGLTLLCSRRLIICNLCSSVLRITSLRRRPARCCATVAWVSLPELSILVRGGRSTGSRRFCVLGWLRRRWLRVRWGVVVVFGVGNVVFGDGDTWRW